MFRSARRACPQGCSRFTNDEGGDSRYCAPTGNAVYCTLAECGPDGP